MGRYLDRVGRARQPAPGPRADGDLAPALATAQMPVAAVDGPGDYDFWAPGVWGEVEDWMLEAFPAIGTDARRRPRRGDARGRRASRSSPRACASSCCPSAASRSRARSPTRQRGRLGLLAAARGARGDARPAGLPLRCVALTAPGDYDTHDSQPDDLAEGLKTTARRRCSRSSATSRRAASPTACSCRSGPSSAAAARRTAPTGTDHGAAGLGHADRHARARPDGRRVPRASSGSTRTATCARPRTSAASTAPCSSSGSGTTPPP